MPETYQWIKGNTAVRRGSDGACIPSVSDNIDWQAYQAWVTGGGVTTPADPPPTPAAILADQRAGAVAQILTDPSSIAKALRSVILAIRSEINILRQRDRDRSVDVAAATTLADLKTRWAARSALADRTIQQTKDVVTDAVTDGTAD